MNLKPKALKDRKCLALFMKVLSSGFSAKAKRALSVRLECLKTWSYAICALSKHNLLFYDDKKGNIPFKTLVTPFMELVETKNMERDISQRIINVMTQLLTTNVNENENRLLTPCDVDMKDMEDPNGEHETASIPMNGNEFGRDNDGMVNNYQWKFSNWSVAMDPILTFCTKIHKLHGDEEGTKCISTFIQTFFRTMRQQRLSKKLPNKYLEQITMFLAKICVMDKTGDQILQRQSLKYSSIVIGASFQHFSKYKENIKKLKCKSLNDTSFGLKLDDCNKDICLFLLKLWLNECDKYGFYPLSDINIYVQFIQTLDDENVSDVISALQLFEQLIENALSQLSKIKSSNKNTTETMMSLCLLISHLFYQTFCELLSRESIGKLMNAEDEFEEITSIQQSMIESLCNFIAAFDHKFNPNYKAYVKVKWSDCEKTKLLKQTSNIMSSACTVFCRLLDGNYNDSKIEWTQNKRTQYMSKPDLIKFLSNIHESLSVKHHHELIFMKWCKYKPTNKSDEGHMFLEDNFSVILIKFGNLLLQSLYKSDEKWYHQIENKKLFQLISSIFVYILHRSNYIQSASSQWIKNSKYFIKSFHSFLSKLSMSNIVNIWSHAISNRLLWYINHIQSKPQLALMESCESEESNDAESNKSFNKAITQCFMMYIHVTCNYSSVSLLDKVKRTPSKSKKSKENNLQIKFIDLLHSIMRMKEGSDMELWNILNNSIELKSKQIFKFIAKTLQIKLDSGTMKQQYPSFAILYGKFQASEKKKAEKEISKSVETEALKKTEVDKETNQKSKTIEPILKPKSSIVSTRSRRRSRRKKKVNDEVNGLGASCLTYNETQMSFDIFDENLDDQNGDADGVVVESRASKEEEEDVDDDVDMKDVDHEREKGLTSTSEDQCGIIVHCLSFLFFAFY